MITNDEIAEIGKFAKPHGIHGELTLVVDDNVDTDLLSRIVVNMDGINVPFFIESLRPKRTDSVIVKLEGIDSDTEAAAMANRPVSALLIDNVSDSDGGMYASDLIGFTIVHANGVAVGEIVDVDDSTDNALFLVNTPQDTTVYIPIADELIDEIDPARQIIVMTIPEGLLNLN